jgi:hypothetical protein
MSAPRPHVFPKKRFQAATVSAIDSHAAFLGELAGKVHAQGELLADLAVARDTLQTDLHALHNTFNARLHRPECLVSHSTCWQRLRWLLTGK